MTDDKIAQAERPQYFYVPVVNADESYGGYSTMDECVAKHGSGQLVCNHLILDDLHEATKRTLALPEVLDVVEELRAYVNSDIGRPSKALAAFDALVGRDALTRTGEKS